MTDHAARFPWLTLTPALTAWLDADRKGRHDTRTNADWLRQLDPARKSRDPLTGTHTLHASVGFTLDVPADVWHAANLPVIVPCPALTYYGPMTHAASEHIAVRFATDGQLGSRTYLTRQADDAHEALADLNAGRVTPRRILGLGATKTDARAYLTRQLHAATDALADDGTSDTENRRVAWTTDQRGRAEVRALTAA